MPDHPQRPLSPATGIVTVVMTLLGWSSVPLFITHFAATIDAWTSNGWRYGLSALLWAPVLIWGLRRRSLPPGLWRAAIIPAIANALGQAAFAWSFYKVDPATATFALRTQLIFVAIGAYWLFPGERAVLRSPITWVAIAMVLSGIAGTVFLGEGQRSEAEVFGVLLGLASGVLFAAYALSVRRFMTGYHPVIAFAAISQYTAAAMVVLMLVLAHNTTTNQWNAGASAWALSNTQFALLLLSAVLGIALGHVFYYISIARLGVAVTSGVIQLQPFVVAVAQYYLFDKALTWPQVAAGCIALAGAVTLLCVQQRMSRRLRRDAAVLAAVQATALDGALVPLKSPP